MRRRDLLLRAGAASATAAGVLPAAARADIRDQLKREEKVAVAGAVSAEQAAMVAFEAMANGGVLGTAASATMRVLRDHAAAHSDLLAQTFKDELDDDPPLPPKRTQIRGLAGLRDERAGLELALRLEQAAIRAHLAAVRKSKNAQIMKAIAGVIGSDGQALVVLRQLLGMPPVPSAFERGTA